MSLASDRARPREPAPPTPTRARLDPGPPVELKSMPNARGRGRSASVEASAARTLHSRSAPRDSTPPAEGLPDQYGQPRRSRRSSHLKAWVAQSVERKDRTRGSPVAASAFRNVRSIVLDSPDYCRGNLSNVVARGSFPPQRVNRRQCARGISRNVRAKSRCASGSQLRRVADRPPAQTLLYERRRSAPASANGIGPPISHSLQGIRDHDHQLETGRPSAETPAPATQKSLRRASAKMANRHDSMSFLRRFSSSGAIEAICGPHAETLEPLRAPRSTESRRPPRPSTGRRAAPTLSRASAHHRGRIRRNDLPQDPRHRCSMSPRPNAACAH